MRLDQALLLLLERTGVSVSRSQLKQHIDRGSVLVNAAPAKAGLKLRFGDDLAFAPPPPQQVDIAAQAMPLTILFEDAHLVVIDKPAGLVVHPAAGHADGTLVNALLAHCGDSLAGIGGERRPGIVHRLDKDTSGVLVVAKDAPTMTALGALFKAHLLERRYLAVVVGAPPPALTLRTLYGRDPAHRKRFSSRVERGKAAVTHVTVKERLHGAALVGCKLETGRTHQIRVHMRDAGYPILGDPTYGRRSSDQIVREVGATLGRQALHAAVLAFDHPITRQPLRFETQPPADLSAAIERLRAVRKPESR